ncbi:hypothetical protein BC830DRAFT_77244 [Chytriomyces sp. MP71]|nr:hypothetical protein BC830DRAFT_77244 [Chytriomyces sp. MP71]
MESPTRPPTGSSGVRTAAAKEYVGRLQATLSGDAYAKFVGIMARFKARQLTKRGLVSEMDDLFSDLDRPDLLAGFDVFLPHGVSVDQIREQNSKCSTYSTDTAAARASLTLATASVSTAPPTTLSLQPHSQVSVIHENTSPPLPLAPAAEPPKQVTRQSAENNLHKETISLSESGSIGSSLWFATQGSTSTQQASASVPEPSSHADQLDALTCKVQLRFVEMGTPEKYQDFLNLMAESKLRPSSYPAVCQCPLFFFPPRF